MRSVALVIGAIGLAACEMLPGGGGSDAAPPSVPPERVEAFVFAVERTGCTVDPVSHDSLHQAGFSDNEMADISSVLVTDGRARLADNGALILQTEDCL